MIVVYLVTNNVTGKQYIGFTAQSLRRRWSGHLHSARKGARTAIHSAIRKYGFAAFSITEIATCATRGEAAETEARLIVWHQTKAPNGYNLTDGGEGVRGLAPEMLERIAAMNRGRHHTDDARQRIGRAAIGRQKSEKGRAAISAARRGKQLSPEHRQKLSAAKLGKKMPPRSSDHKARISAGLVLAHARRSEAKNAGIL